LLTSLPITFALTSGTKLRLEVRPQSGPSAFGAMEVTVA